MDGQPTTRGAGARVATQQRFEQLAGPQAHWAGRGCCGAVVIAVVADGDAREPGGGVAYSGRTSSSQHSIRSRNSRHNRANDGLRFVGKRGEPDDFRGVVETAGHAGVADGRL